MAGTGDGRRDIDLLLITGAGASCEFGSAQRNGRLVMMAGWSNALVKKLASGGMGYLEATGLATGLTGQEFELRLGRFLRSAAAFKESSSLVGPSVQFQSWQFPINEQALTDWHRSSCFHVDRITSLIHETLYEEFGPTAIDTFAAQPSYEWIFDQLQVPRTGSSVVIATTNYDSIAEGALELMGRLPDWGAAPSIMQYTETELKVEGLLQGLPRYTPVLHLHGRVGWYQRPGERPRSTSAQQHQDGYGQPVVVLPDPEKSYEDVLLTELWREFGDALSRAKRVFVLGHSLCDDALVAAINEAIIDRERLGVGWLSDPANPEEFDPGTISDLESAQERLQGGYWLQTRFGRSPTMHEGRLKQWLTSLPPD